MFADEPLHQWGDIGDVINKVDSLPAAPNAPPWAKAF
jgi:hypothetical protein